MQASEAAKSNRADPLKSQGAYRVIVRVRPPVSTEQGAPSIVEVLGQSKLQVQRDGQRPLLLKFDTVLGPEVGQSKAFEAVSEIVAAALEGKSGAIIAYGQTGSGKTHTICGDLSTPDTLANDECRGIIPRTLELLFQLIAVPCSDRVGRPMNWRICISFLEIYNERVYDLLAEEPRLSSEVCAWDKQGRSGIDEGRLDVREYADGTVWVPGATSVEVLSRDQAHDVLRIGTLSRTCGDNGVNQSSSRSHAIFQISLEKRVGNSKDGNLLQSTKLSLVDLAGSEKLQSDSFASGALLQELTCINHSLSALGQCISALVERRAHVPCRNSKLTRLLQDSLRGSSLTTMCICISPTSMSLEETLSSLKFADRAKRAVIARPAPCASSAANVSSKQVATLTAQVRDLKDKLTTERQERMRLQTLLEAQESAGEISDVRQSPALSPGDFQIGGSSYFAATNGASTPPRRSPTSGLSAHTSEQELVTKNLSHADTHLGGCSESLEEGGSSSASTSAGPSGKLVEHEEESGILETEASGFAQLLAMASSVDAEDAYQVGDWEEMQTDPMAGIKRDTSSSTVPSPTGATPFMMPSYEGHIEVVQALIAERADADRASNEGRPESPNSDGSFESCISDWAMQLLGLAASQEEALPQVSSVQTQSSSTQTKFHSPGELPGFEAIQSTMETPEEAQACENGHPMPATFKFCSECGGTRKAIQPIRSPSPLSVQQEASKFVWPQSVITAPIARSSEHRFTDLAFRSPPAAMPEAATARENMASPFRVHPKPSWKDLAVAQAVAKAVNSADSPQGQESLLSPGASKSPDYASCNLLDQRGILMSGGSSPSITSKVVSVPRRVAWTDIQLSGSHNNALHQHRVLPDMVLSAARTVSSAHKTDDSGDGRASASDVERPATVPRFKGTENALVPHPGPRADQFHNSVRWKPTRKQVGNSTAQKITPSAFNGRNLHGDTTQSVVLVAARNDRETKTKPIALARIVRHDPMKSTASATDGSPRKAKLTSKTLGRRSSRHEFQAGAVTSPMRNKNHRTIVAACESPGADVSSSAEAATNNEHHLEAKLTSKILGRRLSRREFQASAVTSPMRNKNNRTIVAACESPEAYASSSAEAATNNEHHLEAHCLGDADATAAKATEQLRRQKESLRRGRDDRARRRSEEREAFTDSSAERLQALISETRSRRPVSPGVGDIASLCWQEFEGALRAATPRA